MDFDVKLNGILLKPNFEFDGEQYNILALYFHRSPPDAFEFRNQNEEEYEKKK